MPVIKLTEFNKPTNSEMAAISLRNMITVLAWLIAATEALNQNWINNELNLWLNAVIQSEMKLH